MAHFLSPGVTNRFTSHKWVQFKEDRGLVVEDVNCVFSLVRNDFTNLISIFGRARQGKSFLMNCLAGEREIFKVSNEKESCTQGIDISNKWLPLKNFSTIDGGTEVYTNMPTKIGFVDAEGQGDRDITYDANLVCPILLASKCVIFNWKGDLQKDHILSTLGIMTRAAKNVGDETDNDRSSSSSSPRMKKFGHLHICFRDWQAPGTSEKSVFQALFADETGCDAAIRNQIRRDIMQNFTSVSVWLFEAPVDSTKQLKEKLTYQMTSHSFKTKLRMLRNMLSQQLRDPTLVASRELSGQTMGMFVKQIACALNNGESVLPSSAYKSMMTQEIQRVVSVLQSSIAEKLQFIVNELEVLSSNPSNTKRVFPNEVEARQAAERAIDEVMNKYSAKIQSVFGDGKCKLSHDISKELPDTIQQIKQQSIQQFMNAHQANLANYVSIVCQQAEEKLYYELQRLGSDNCECMDTDTLNDYLVTMFNDIVQSIGGINRFQSSIWVNRLESIRMVFMTGKDKVAEMHKERYSVKQEDAHRTLSFAQSALLECMQNAVRDLVSTRPQGFPKQDIVDRMNCKYRELKMAVSDTVPEKGCMYTYIIEELKNVCKQLQADLHEEYAIIRNDALQDASRNLMHDLSVEAEAFASEKMFETTLNSWSQENFNPLDARNHHRIREKLDNWIQQIYDILVGQNKEDVAGWDDLETLFDSLVEVPNQKFVFSEFGKARAQFLRRLEQWKLDRNDQYRSMEAEEYRRIDMEEQEQYQQQQQQEMMMTMSQNQSQNSSSRRQSLTSAAATPQSMRRTSTGGMPASGGSYIHSHSGGLPLSSPSPALRRSTFLPASPAPNMMDMNMYTYLNDPNIMYIQKDDVAELRDTIYEARIALAEECAQAQLASSSTPLSRHQSNRNTPMTAVSAQAHAVSSAQHNNSNSNSNSRPQSSRNTPVVPLQRISTPTNKSPYISTNSSSNSYHSGVKISDPLLGKQIEETVRLFSEDQPDYGYSHSMSNNRLDENYPTNSYTNDEMNTDDRPAYNSVQNKDQHIESERQKAIEYALKMGFVMPDSYGSTKKGVQSKRRSTISASSVRSSGYGQSPGGLSSSSMKVNSSIDRSRLRFDKENSKNFI